MKLYYAQINTDKGIQKICITEQFYEYLKTKNKKYTSNGVSLDYSQFKESEN